MENEYAYCKIAFIDSTDSNACNLVTDNMIVEVKIIISG